MESLNSDVLGQSDSEAGPHVSLLPQTRTIVRERLCHASFLPRHLCLPSKAAVLILFWTLVVSAIYTTATESAGVVAQIVSNKIHIGGPNLNEKIFFSYLSFALASLFYPLAGFLADVYVGRYRVVIISLLLLFSSHLCLSIVSILYLTRVIVPESDGKITKNPILFIILGAIASFLSIIGLAGYQANYIQFGLDQLLEARSEYLGLFVHWVQWFTMLGYLFMEILFAWYTCHYEVHAKDVVISSPMMFVLALALLLVISFYNRQWFYTITVRHNPYKVVFKVLNFARKHEYPLRRSAFTYCDDEKPSRIDFAKERYGGPFTTEQVEDVKTFLRMLLVLLALGPVFVLDIPSDAVFALFAQHFTTNRIGDRPNCTMTWATLDTGALKYLIAVVFFLTYIWLVYSLLRNCIPRIFTRLWIGHFLFVAGVVSMLVIDLVGHIIYFYQNRSGSVCMFYSQVQKSPEMALGMHWAVLILPNLMIGIAPLLVMTTTFEFISAQSPHSMTGMFVGLFLAIRGFFQFIGSIVLYPFFSLDAFWKHKQLVISCGSGYLLFTCVVGVLSLIFLTVVAKRYKYRERDDPPYNRMHVERVFAEYSYNAS